MFLHVHCIFCFAYAHIQVTQEQLTAHLTQAYGAVDVNIIIDRESSISKGCVPHIHSCMLSACYCKTGGAPRRWVFCVFFGGVVLSQIAHAHSSPQAPSTDPQPTTHNPHTSSHITSEALMHVSFWAALSSAFLFFQFWIRNV